MKASGRFIWAALLGALFIGNVWADRPYRHHSRPHSGVGFGLYLGAPWVYPRYDPYYYAPPQIYMPPLAPVIVAPPPVYIEQPSVVMPTPAYPPAPAPATAPTLEPGFWYFCREAGAYYPYVRQCPGGWQQVAPQPVQ